MSTLYHRGQAEFGKGNIDWENDTIKLAFMSTSYTPDDNSDAYYSDVSADVAAGSTDQTLANCAVNIDSANSRVEYDSDDVSVGSQTFSTDKVVIYKDTGVASTSPLILCSDITEGTLSPVADTITITVDSNGWFSQAST